MLFSGVPLHEADVDRVLGEKIHAGDIVVPPFPSVLSRLTHAVATGAPLPEVASIVASDGTLATSVIRLAGSAAFSRTGDGVSLRDAVVRIGINEVKRLCMASSLAQTACGVGPLFAIREKLWRESMVASLLCPAIARFHKADPESAGIAGLLHDFGKIVVLSAAEQVFDAHTLPVDEAFWEDILERHHCDVGFMMAERWDVPPPVPDIIATHHLDIQPAIVPLIDVVHVADSVQLLVNARKDALSIDEISELDGVESLDEAMAIRVALAQAPHFIAAATTRH